MSVPGGKSISGRDTCRKLNGFPSARARASSVLTTSYGTLATCSARSGCGRKARKGRITATDPPGDELDCLWSKTSRLGAKTQTTLESTSRTDEQNHENDSTHLTRHAQVCGTAGGGLVVVADGVVGRSSLCDGALVFAASGTRD